MSLGERWSLLILVELLTFTQWVEVRGDLWWYWWNCWPSLNELKWEVIFVDMVELLTITQCVEVRGDLWWYWWNCWLSLNELKWDVICGYIGDGQQFHQYQQKSPLTLTHWVELLTITQWVEVRGDFCWYWWNCWPSLNELRWEVIFVDIGGIVDHHSMWLGERWFCWFWLMVNNSTNIDKNHLSSSLIWVMVNNSTNISKHHLLPNHIDDGQQFHQYQQKSPLTSTHWVELLTITQWVE